MNIFKLNSISVILFSLLLNCYLCDEPLYEDKFVKITESQVQIKWYYFPSCQSKIIPIKDIEKVVTMYIGWGSYKLWWGSQYAYDHWLACDITRFLQTQFVSIHIKDTIIKPGFTALNPNEVLKIINNLLKSQKGSNSSSSSQQKIKQEQEF